MKIISKGLLLVGLCLVFGFTTSSANTPLPQNPKGSCDKTDTFNYKVGDSILFRDSLTVQGGNYTIKQAPQAFSSRAIPVNSWQWLAGSQTTFPAGVHEIIGAEYMMTFDRVEDLVINYIIYGCPSDAAGNCADGVTPSYYTECYLYKITDPVVPKYDVYQCQDNGNWAKTASSVTQTQGSQYNSSQNYDRTSVVWTNEGAAAPSDATCNDPVVEELTCGAGINISQLKEGDQTPVTVACATNGSVERIYSFPTSFNLVRNGNSATFSIGDITAGKSQITCVVVKGDQTKECPVDFEILEKEDTCPAIAWNMPVCNGDGTVTVSVRGNEGRTIEFSNNNGLGWTHPFTNSITTSVPYNQTIEWKAVVYSSGCPSIIGYTRCEQNECTPDNSNAVNVCSDTTFMNNCGTTVYGTKSCVNPDDKPVRQCTANGWIKTDKRWNWANYAPNGHYQIGNEASLNEGETPSSTTCGEGANDKPVRQCTASGWTKTDKRWNWANYDSSRAYQLNDEASLNEGETPASTTCTAITDKPVRQCTESGWIKTTKRWTWANYDSSRAYQLNDEASLNEGETPASTTCNNPGYTQMRLTKTASTDTVNSGDLVTYTITMYNDGPGIITNSRISDVLPEGMIFVDSSRGYHVKDTNDKKVRGDDGYFREILANGTIIQRTTPTWGPYDNGEWKSRQHLLGDQYTWFWGDIPAGQNRSFTVTAKYNGSQDGQCMINTAFGGMDTPEYPRNRSNDNDSVTVCTQGVSPVDVQITKTVDKTGFVNNTGEIITWTLNYQNNGPATATGVVIVDILPKELNYDPVGIISDPKFTFTAEALTGGRTQLTWILKNPLLVGISDTITVRTSYKGGAADGYRIINPVAITATNDSDPTNNTSAAHTVPFGTVVNTADVQIFKSVDKTGFVNNTGEIITWTLNYQNNGPSVASGVTITDTVPASMEYFGEFLPNLELLPGNLIKYTIGTLQPGQTGSKTFQTRYKGGVANGTSITNNVLIETITLETDYTNNTGSAVTTPFGSRLASLGDYVWIDSNKDGIQNSGEVALAGVKVELYKPTSCTADLIAPIATTTTNGSGYYLFTGLQAGNYKVKFILPNGYEFTLPNQGSDDALDSDAGLSGVTSCITLAEGENNMTVDAGVLLEQLISCEGLTLSTTTMSVGGSVTYNCVHKNASQATFTLTLTGSTGAVVSMTGFTGQFTVANAGIYNAQCTLDNGITYKVGTFTATGSGISCAYKKHLTNADVCAVKSALDPFVSPELNLSALISIPTPYPYCTTAQIADTNYQCVDAPVGSQIVTRDDMACMKQLTVSSGGGGGGGGGGGTYRYCGDGRVDSPNTNGIREECDGNDTATQICTNQCVYIPRGTNPPGPSNPAKPKPISLPSCETIDPPSINKGEYMPFWWSLEADSDVNFVSSCANAQADKTNVINKVGSDKTDNPLCHFSMYVDNTEKTPAAQFNKYCFEDSDLDQYPLFTDFFVNYPQSKTDYARSKNSSFGGSSFFGPSSWSTVPNLYGEYKLSLDKSTFYICEEVDDGNGGTIWKQSTQRYQATNDDGYVTECSYNFTVTTPYFVQKGNSLGTELVSQDIINNFHSFDSAGSIINNIIKISQYSRSNNLGYLAEEFANKYTQLAKPYNTNFSKVPGKEIYIKNAAGALPIPGGDLPRGTIVSNGGDIIIQGEVKGQVMMIANGGTIYFQPTDTDQVQYVEGIYIGDSIKSTGHVFNDDIYKSTWSDKGGLTIKGAIITKNAGDITNLYNARRSHLEDWFKTDSDVSNYKQKAILDGAALMIETDPSFWTNLPPGANELMSALQTYK